MQVVHAAAAGSQASPAAAGSRQLAAQGTLQQAAPRMQATPAMSANQLPLTLLSSRSASSASLSDSLPDETISALLQRPAAAAPASTQTSSTAQPDFGGRMQVAAADDGMHSQPQFLPLERGQGSLLTPSNTAAHLIVACS